MNKTNKQNRILVAADQPDVLEALRLLLKSVGYQIETASSPNAVVAALQIREFDCLLIDLNYTRDTTSGQEGLDLLAQLQGIDPSLPVVVMTAWRSVELAHSEIRFRPDRTSPHQPPSQCRRRHGFSFRENCCKMAV